MIGGCGHQDRVVIHKYDERSLPHTPAPCQDPPGAICPGRWISEKGAEHFPGSEQPDFRGIRKNAKQNEIILAHTDNLELEVTE